LYINIPARFSFDTLTPQQAIELIEAKIEKEANRYIHHWPEAGISVENGRWGPFIKFGKAIVNLPRIDGAKMNADHALTLTLEDVKKIIVAEIPGAFDEKKPAKKAGAKTAAKKPAAKKKA
jgi:DNA topoisomerase-1